MLFKTTKLAAALAAVVVLTACNSGSDGKDGAQGPAGENATDSTILLSLLGRHETGQFDESAAEIVDFDPTTNRIFVVNANSGKVDVLDATTPASPSLIESLDIAADVAAATSGISATDLGAANSVSVYADVIAVAIEANPKQNTGYIAFYQTDGTFLSAVEAGALPDMVTFTPNGQKVIAANEGEPNADYSVDPEGTITIVDVSGGFSGLSASNVTQLSLGSMALTGPVRISPNSASQGADLEPEYIAVSEDSTTAYVTLQENNAIATINLSTNSVSAITGIGYKDYSIPGNEFDASNRDDVVNIRNWPVFGVYMPDSLAAYTVSGKTYLVTANEGDGREYDAYLDEIRIKDIQDTGATFDADLVARAGSNFEADEELGRLKIIANLGTSGTCASLATTGQPGADCTYEALYAFGARSFTIWDATTMQPVFDSGNQFEVITSNRYGVDHFNASNDSNEGDDRSDDKGPEPEGVAIGVVEGKTYAFIGLERVGGVMVYNISNPQAAEFVQYINERDFSVADVETDLALVGDLGPEGLKFVSADHSPTGSPMLLVGNEVSGTTTIYHIELLP